jgi:hypothetical protein
VAAQQSEESFSIGSTIRRLRTILRDFLPAAMLSYSKTGTFAYGVLRPFSFTDDRTLDAVPNFWQKGGLPKEPRESQIKKRNT